MDWYTTDDGKYSIQSLSAATFPGALEVIRVGFCLDEAVCIGTEVNKNPLAAEELLELCADTALDGISLVAVAKDTEEVAAVAFNKLQVLPDSTEPTFFDFFARKRCKQPSARRLIEFMAEVDSRVNLFEKYNVDCSLEIMFLATLRHHRRHNLGYLLCKISLDLGKKLKDGPFSTMTVEDLGPKYSMMQPRVPTTKFPKISQAIWTAAGSQKIGMKLGFKVHLSVSFEDFEFNGKTFAERIDTPNLYTELAARII